MVRAEGDIDAHEAVVKKYQVWPQDPLQQREQ